MKRDIMEMNPSVIRQIPGYSYYLQVKNFLYNKILSSDMRSGQRLWTEVELTNSLGVSTITVRRALDEMVREGIIERYPGKGTFLKRSLPLKIESSQTILILSLRPLEWMLNDAYYGEIFPVLGEMLGKKGYQLTAITRNWGKNIGGDIEEIRRYNPAGIIFLFNKIFSQPLIRELNILSTPVLLMDEPLSGFLGAQIYPDNYGGGAMAAKYFLDKGYHSFRIITGPADSESSTTRVRGFLDMVREKGIEVSNEAFIEGDWGEQSGYQAVDKLLIDKRHPTGIFCCGDLMAYGAIKRLQELGMKVPEDIAVMGFGDFKVSPLYYPNLTTIQIDKAGMGRKMAEWLVMAAERDDYPQAYQEKLPVKLIEGDTA